MNDLLIKIHCPRGCKNPMFTETIKLSSNENNEKSNLLLEGNSFKIKSYTCQCCGSSFDIRESRVPQGKYIL